MLLSQAFLVFILVHKMLQFFFSLAQKTFFLFLLFFPICFASALGIEDLIYPISYESPPDVPTLESEMTATEKVFAVFLALVNIILYLGGVGATVIIVLAGVRMTFSVGSEDQIEGAKKMLLYAVLGLLAIFLSLLVIQNIANLFYPG